jgi:hypothetical protein
MIRRLVGPLIALSFLRCSLPFRDTFNSEILTSSKGEKIYINSLNWGVTDDYQMSAVTSNPGKLKDRGDSSSTVHGLEPFYYSFENDTLTLFFDGDITYNVSENFKTINLKYVALDIREYGKISRQAFVNDGYFAVPKREWKHRL